MGAVLARTCTRRVPRAPVVLGLVTLVAASCAIDRAGQSSGDAARDAGARRDVGTIEVDAFVEPPPDAPLMLNDSGPRDAGPPDAGPPDTGPPDAGCTPTAPPREICDGLDNDCDGIADNLAPADRRRFYADADGDGHGTMAMSTDAFCTAPPGFAATSDDCNDADALIHPGAIERCNALDDNCSGVLDDGATTCPGCEIIHWPATTLRPYLFCGANMRWTAAKADCEARGYELITINDDPENEFIYDSAWGMSEDGWWIGLNDRAMEDTWVWDGGRGSGYLRWHTGEPNDTAMNEDCVTTGQWGPDDPRWNDSDCATALSYICEVIP
jgi:hypothetical protein